MEHPDEPSAANLCCWGFSAARGAVRAAFSPLDGAASVKAGQALQLNTYWRALKPMKTDYVLYLHLLDEQGHIRAQRDTPIRANDYPTSHWQTGELVVDINDLLIPNDLQAGEYQLAVGLYRADTLQRLSLVRHADSELSLATIVVK